MLLLLLALNRINIIVSHHIVPEDVYNYLLLGKTSTLEWQTPVFSLKPPYVWEQENDIICCLFRVNKQLQSHTHCYMQ